MRASVKKKWKRAKKNDYYDNSSFEKKKRNENSNFDSQVLSPSFSFLLSPARDISERVSFPPPPRVVRDPRHVEPGQESQQTHRQQAPRRSRCRTRQPPRRSLPRKDQADCPPDQEQEGDGDFFDRESVRRFDVLSRCRGGFVGPAVGGGLERGDLREEEVEGRG